MSLLSSEGVSATVWDSCAGWVVEAAEASSSVLSSSVSDRAITLCPLTLAETVTGTAAASTGALTTSGWRGSLDYKCTGYFAVAVLSYGQRYIDRPYLHFIFILQQPSAVRISKCYKCGGIAVVKVSQHQQWNVMMYRPLAQKEWRLDQNGSHDDCYN